MPRECRPIFCPFLRPVLSSRLVYFLPSLRARTAKTLICTKIGVSAGSRKSAKKCGKPHFLRIFCARSAVVRTLPHLLALFLESAETQIFLQINVFAVRALRLARKYTSPGFRRTHKRFVAAISLWGVSGVSLFLL